MTDPVPLSALPVGAFFELPGDPRVWRVVYPPLPTGAPDHTPYGVGYQPTNDGNSVYAVEQGEALLFRMQAGIMGRRLTGVRVVRDLC